MSDRQSNLVIKYIYINVDLKTQVGVVLWILLNLGGVVEEKL